MKLNEKEKELENSEERLNVIALKDVDRADKTPDWLTPMNRLSKFVCIERVKFRHQIYLQAFTKIINHEHCVELIEHFQFSGVQDMVQYVFAEQFCTKFELIEIVDEYTGTV